MSPLVTIPSNEEIRRRNGPRRAQKAKSAVSAARHFMGMSENVSEEVKAKAEELIEEIEAALEDNDNTRAAGRGEKLNKLLAA